MSEKLLEISGLSVCYEGEQILNNICFYHKNQLKI